MPLSQQPSIKKELLPYAPQTSSNTFGDVRTKTDWRTCTKQSGILTSSLQRRKNKARKMLLYKMRFLLILLFPLTSYGQVLIDTNTIKQANHYLVKGAIAREQVTVLRKIVTSDSIIIAEQDSIIVKVRINNAHLREKNKELVSENKAISRTLSLFKNISIGLSVLMLVGWLK